MQEIAQSRPVRFVAVLVAFTACFTATIALAFALFGAGSITAVVLYAGIAPLCLAIFAAGSLESSLLWSKLFPLYSPTGFVPGPCSSGISAALFAFGLLKYQGAYFLQ